MPIPWAADAAIGATHALDGDDAARAEVIAALQQMVTANLAQWWVTEDGGLQLHLHTGEVFQLHARHITRLR